MKTVAEHIDGYAFGAAEISVSPVTMRELEDLKASVEFTEEDERYLRMAGSVLEGRTKQMVEHWRSRNHRERFRIWRDTRALRKVDLSPDTWRRATSALSSGFWTPASAPTTRRGSTTNMR